MVSGLSGVPVGRYWGCEVQAERRSLRTNVPYERPDGIEGTMGGRSNVKSQKG